MWLEEDKNLSSQNPKVNYFMEQKKRRYNDVTKWIIERKILDKDQAIATLILSYGLAENSVWTMLETLEKAKLIKITDSFIYSIDEYNKKQKEEN